MTEGNHACMRCGATTWAYCDYGGCSVCRPYEARAAEDEEDKVAAWVAWALTTPLRYGLSTFGRRAGCAGAMAMNPSPAEVREPLTRTEVVAYHARKLQERGYCRIATMSLADSLAVAAAAGYQPDELYVDVSGWLYKRDLQVPWGQHLPPPWERT